MENKNSQGIFLGVMGVATLVVAIIGATFAYFSASVSGNAPVNAESYKFAMTLSVTPTDPATTPSKGDKLIPLTETDISKAVTAGCADKNGYAACRIYSLEFNNTGSSAVTLNGTLTPTSNDFTSLKYSVTAIDGAKSTLAAGTSISGTTAVSTGLTGLVIPANTTKTMYLMLYINNDTEANQPNDQGKSFSGTLTFNDASGGTGKLEATFNTTG